MSESRDKLGRFVKGNKEGFQKGHKPFLGTEKTRFKKGQIPWNKNKENWMSEESKRSMIEKKKGKLLWPNGRVFSEGHKKNLGLAHKGKKLSAEHIKNMSGKTPWNKGIPCSEKSKEKMRLATALARQRGCYNMKPNKPEKIMWNIIKENNLPFNYTGDGQVIIGGFNPDFLSKNPKHIIEVNGDYWHNLPNVKEKDRRKLKTYSQYGYKTLVIWEHELKNPFMVLDKINNFVGGRS